MSSVSELPTLEGPYEFAEVVEGKPLILSPTSFEIGKAQTHPPWTPAGTMIWYEIVRIHVPTTQKPLFPYYWDFGQKTLVPQLKALLPTAKLQNASITVEAVGTGPKKRFSVGLTTV